MRRRIRLNEFEDKFIHEYYRLHYDAEYYRIISAGEVITYEELTKRLIEQGSDEWWVCNDIDDGIDDGLYEVVSKRDAEQILVKQ